jgi:hypothetical protein
MVCVVLETEMGERVIHQCKRMLKYNITNCYIVIMLAFVSVSPSPVTNGSLLMCNLHSNAASYPECTERSLVDCGDNDVKRFSLSVIFPPSIFQPPQIACCWPQFSRIISTDICAIRMAVWLEWNIGKNAGWGSVTAWGRCRKDQSLRLLSVAWV